MIHSNGIIRVGGRLSPSTLLDSTRYPALLPRYGHITGLVIHYYHTTMQHQGHGITMNELRACRYRIIAASGAVLRKTSNYVFRSCEVLYKSSVWRNYQNAVFIPHHPSPTVLSISLAHSQSSRVVKNLSCMERFSRVWRCKQFISALCRFICRRGSIRQLQSDQGTNFVGAQRELKRLH